MNYIRKYISISYKKERGKTEHYSDSYFIFFIEIKEVLRREIQGL